jgi:L-lactate dehydrogenase complex protein LldE
MRVALFITCLADAFAPRVGVAAVKVLEHLGHEVVFPRDQTCCGQPMFNNGFHAQAAAAVRHFLQVFAPFETIVTPSASCAAMVREHFPRLFEPGSPEREAALAMGRRTFEFVELLAAGGVDLGELGVRWTGRATCHFPCHRRGLGPGDDTERLLAGVEGLELRPLERREQCCGFGGTFALHYPPISGAMSRDKVECVRRSGAETLVSNDTGCSLNLAGACRRAGCDARVVSFAEIVAEGLGLMERER